jgi:hypothetical protein
MKFRNIFWGVILIFIGVLFFLQNLHVIHFDWVNLWRLWPVIFVLWGVSILPTNSWLKLILTLLVLGASLFFVANQTSSWDNFDQKVEWWDNWDKNDKTVLDQYFDVPYDDSAQYAVLSLDAAAGSFLINQTTDQLLEFDKRGSWTNYSYLVKKLDDKTEVMIEPEGDRFNIVKGKNRNDINISLNNYPIWEMILDVGASSMDFDLTSYKLKKLDVDGGAASFDIKLGDLYPETYVTIDAGASSIALSVPESSGCDLKISTVLSGRDVYGFEKIDHGHYQTENFEEAANKIFIEVDAAVSSYSITRY